MKKDQPIVLVAIMAFIVGLGTVGHLISASKTIKATRAVKSIEQTQERIELLKRLKQSKEASKSEDNLHDITKPIEVIDDIDKISTELEDQVKMKQLQRKLEIDKEKSSFPETNEISKEQND